MYPGDWVGKSWWCDICWGLYQINIFCCIWIWAFVGQSISAALQYLIIMLYYFNLSFGYRPKSYCDFDHKSNNQSRSLRKTDLRCILKDIMSALSCSKRRLIRDWVHTHTHTHTHTKHFWFQYCVKVKHGLQHRALPIIHSLMLSSWEAREKIADREERLEAKVCEKQHVKLWEGPVGCVVILCLALTCNNTWWRANTVTQARKSLFVFSATVASSVCMKFTSLTMFRCLRDVSAWSQ